MIRVIRVFRVFRVFRVGVGGSEPAGTPDVITLGGNLKPRTQAPPQALQ